MSLRTLLSFSLFLGLATTCFAQSVELLTTYTKSQLAATAAVFGIPSDSFSAEYDVNAYRVTYDMPYLGRHHRGQRCAVRAPRI